MHRDVNAVTLSKRKFRTPVRFRLYYYYYHIYLTVHFCKIRRLPIKCKSTINIHKFYFTQTLFKFLRDKKYYIVVFFSSFLFGFTSVSSCQMRRTRVRLCYKTHIIIYTICLYYILFLLNRPLKNSYSRYYHYLF